MISQTGLFVTNESEKILEYGIFLPDFAQITFKYSRKNCPTGLSIENLFGLGC